MSGIKKEMNFFIPTNCVGYKDYIRPSGIMDILQDTSSHGKIQMFRPRMVVKQTAKRCS